MALLFVHPVYSALDFTINLNKTNKVLIPTTRTSTGNTSKDFMLPRSSHFITFPISQPYFRFACWERLKQPQFAIPIYQILGETSTGSGRIGVECGWEEGGLLITPYTPIQTHVSFPPTHSIVHKFTVIGGWGSII